MPQPTSILCTLFEGHYHLGAAALINSLQAAGFTGTVVAGYRGAPPAWAGGKNTLEPGAGLVVQLVPLDTQYHLTNYKPDFMLRQSALPGDDLWYLDPDIVVTARWSVFRDWCAAGIALCEDVNSPLSFHHPRREGWRRHFAASGIRLAPRETQYANGGCIGLTRPNLPFLETWRNLQNAMAGAIGGLEQSKLNGGTSELMRDPHFCFNASDQDALNAAVEASPADTVFSILGRSAMAFEPGAALLPHALGTPKPWRKAYLREAFSGRPPTPADKAFWAFADGPLKPFPAGFVRKKRRDLRLAAFLGRFYRRN